MLLNTVFAFLLHFLILLITDSNADVCSRCSWLDQEVCQTVHIYECMNWILFCTCVLQGGSATQSVCWAVWSLLTSAQPGLHSRSWAVWSKTSSVNSRWVSDSLICTGPFIIYL